MRNFKTLAEGIGLALYIFSAGILAGIVIGSYL
jgi:hypothetical protein